MRYAAMHAGPILALRTSVEHLTILYHTVDAQAPNAGHGTVQTS